MNRHGETFANPPMPGEYKVCPLPDCKYKLLVGPVNVFDVGTSVTFADWVPGESLSDLVEKRFRRELERQEELLKAHLKTHDVREFYRARVKVMQDAYREVDRLMKLADLVFAATAAAEEPEGR